MSINTMRIRIVRITSFYCPVIGSVGYVVKSVAERLGISRATSLDPYESGD